jgi:prepilin-type N-terminal cleavage/methylation domain-containing protein
VTRRQAGFTLTELMVVVSIIGILVTMAIVYLRPRVRPIDVAGRVGDLVREASRRAVALGPLRSDVAIALGTKARTQITATVTTATSPAPPFNTITTATFTLWRLQENPLPASSGTWIALAQYTTDAKVDVESWAPGAVSHTAAGRTTSWTAWSPPAGTPPPVSCRPDGTCDACTVFFQAVPAGPSCDPTASPAPPAATLYDQCAKLSVMPLGGAISTRTDWN